MVQDNRGAWSEEATVRVMVGEEMEEEEEKEQGSSSGLFFLGALMAMILIGVLVFPTPLQSHLRSWLKKQGILERRSRK